MGIYEIAFTEAGGESVTTDRNIVGSKIWDFKSVAITEEKGPVKDIPLPVGSEPQPPKV